MAGDWIKMRVDLYEDPAVTRIAESMGEREEVVVGYLHRVWSYLSRQCHDGTVTGVTLVSLGRLANVPGFPELMCDVGWLIEVKAADSECGLPQIKVPHWDRWLSESAKQRGLAAIRKRKQRHADVTEKSRSLRDKSVTRGEERRGEKNKENAAHSCASPKQASDEPPSAEQSEPSKFRFPLKSKSGNCWTLPQKDFLDYQRIYGDRLDVEDELRRAERWLLDNADRRPANRKGMLTFLTRWLNRSVNFGRNGKSTAEKGSVDYWVKRTEERQRQKMEAGGR